jgi:hypothetical protein
MDGFCADVGDLGLQLGTYVDEDGTLGVEGR